MILSLAAAGEEKKPLAYPQTKKGDVVDDYHGTQVADPYRWLEDDNAPEVKAWVEEQNKVTFGYLNGIACRGPIAKRLEELFNYPRYSAPFRVGEYYFFSKNDGLQNQSVSTTRKGLDGEPQVFIDPNTLSADGTVRIGLMGESQDDRYMAISRSEAGSDWQEIRVMEIATRRELPDRLRWVKFSGAAWSGDGFYYSRYDEPKAGEELKAKNENQKVYYHKLGDPQEKDALVFADPAAPAALLRRRRFRGRALPLPEHLRGHARLGAPFPRPGQEGRPLPPARARDSSSTTARSTTSAASSWCTPTATPPTTGWWPSTAPAPARRTGKR